MWSILHRTSTKNHVRIRANPKELELVHCSGRLYATQPYGGFPDLPALNEDNLVADLAKFKKVPHSRNPQEVTMDSPPWWRVMLDGYGGQNSLGGESHKGVVGS